MMAGEAVVFFDREAGAEFAYRCKQAGQLVSKMRFVSAQWVGMLSGGAWLRHARRANAMAQLLLERLQGLSGIRVLYPVQSNAVFVHIPSSTLKALARLGWDLYTFIGGGTRLMCSWDTNESDIEQFVADFAAASTPAHQPLPLNGFEP
jgi:threonine aldolase